MESNSTNLPYHGYSSFVGVDYTESLFLDKLCGAILILCLIFGCVLNSFALAFFSKLKTKTLAEKLYSVISGVDLCTCIAQCPVMLALLHLRQPIAFASRPFCGVWIIFFEYCNRMSIYLIVLLSVSRTIAIVRPFTIIYQPAVLLSLIPYTILLLSDVAIGLLFYDQAFYYLQDFSYPIKGFNKNKSVIPNERQLSYMNFQNMFHASQVLIPSIIIFISFVMALMRMQKLPKNLSVDRLVFYKASITVSLATALFLACNLPYFVAMTVLVRDDLTNGTNILEHPNVGPYVWPVTKVVLATLNATSNPVLYFFRITRFRTWVKALALCKQASWVNLEGRLSAMQGSLETTRLPLSASPRRALSFRANSDIVEPSLALISSPCTNMSMSPLPRCNNLMDENMDSSNGSCDYTIIRSSRSRCSKRLHPSDARSHLT